MNFTDRQAAPSPATVVASPSLPLLFLIFLRDRQTEQTVDVGFCRDNLLHVFSYRAALLICGPFLCRQLLIFGFERIHLFQIEYLRPPLIHRAFPGPHSELNIYNQVYLARRRAHVSRCSSIRRWCATSRQVRNGVASTLRHSSEYILSYRGLTYVSLFLSL